MGHCGCAGYIKNHIFKIGDKYILVEEMPFCDFCDIETTISISELREKDIVCFDAQEEAKIKTLTRWMDQEDKTLSFFIDPFKLLGTDEQLKAMTDRVFDAVWEDVDEKKRGTKVLRDITDAQWNRLQEIFDKKFKQQLNEK